MLRNIWYCLENAQHALHAGNYDQQDEAINALFLYLDKTREHYYPALCYDQALFLLRYYLEHVLPTLNLDADTCREITHDYDELWAVLKQASGVAQAFETAFEQLLFDIRADRFAHPDEIARAVLALAHKFFPLPPIRFSSGTFDPFCDHLTILRRNFRYEQAAACFQQMFRHFLEYLNAASAVHHDHLSLINLRSLGEAVLDDFFQAKAILVDNFRQGHIVPLWVSVTCDQTSEHVHFWNQEVDAAMQASADTARQVVGDYLRAEYGRKLPETTAVQCCCSGAEGRLTDTSASLLIGLRIVGAVLGFKSPPATVVTGEVGPDGAIRGVGFIQEKIAAASAEARIERLLLPETNLHECQEQPLQLTLIPVRTFAEAVQQAFDQRCEDWGTAPDVQNFYGRQDELANLTESVCSPAGRLVTILGMGGMGKTTLTRRLAEQVKPHFQYVFWRDVRNAPPLRTILGDSIKFLSEQQALELSEDLGHNINVLLAYLRKHRCLLIFDNLETLLQGGDGGRAGEFQPEYADYGILLQRLGAAEHRSCVLLTSREKPRELGHLEGGSVRTFALGGLASSDAGEFLKTLQGTATDRQTLITHYAGHPLALKLVAATIQDLFQGDIAAFLQANSPLFVNIESLLAQHDNRLSQREREVMYWLAIEREPVSFRDLQRDLVSPRAKRQLPATLEALQHKSLLEKTATGFLLQPVVMEYLTDRLIEEACNELMSGNLALLNSHALVQAQAGDYIRGSQARLILKPIVENLHYEYGCDAGSLETRLRDMLAALQNTEASRPGYAGGNVLNLLRYLQRDLTGWDFSGLRLWQADLRGGELRDANLAGADLTGAAFTETFGNVLSVAFSPDGALLAVGTQNNEILLWQVQRDMQLYAALQGHTGWVWSVAFSPDGRTLASSSQDHTVRLWDVRTGQCRQILRGHTNWVEAVSFSPDGALLASGSYDYTVRLWDAQTGQLLHTLTHEKEINSVVFSPDGTCLASASDVIHLWEVETSNVIERSNLQQLRRWKSLRGHRDRIRSIVFSDDGQTLVSGGDDALVRIWDINTSQCLNTRSGHTDIIKSVVLSPDGQYLASCSDDRTVRVWEVRTGRPLNTFQGHICWVWAVAFHPDGTLVSGSSDQTVRLWDTRRGQCLKLLQGYANRALAVTFSPDSATIASSFSDNLIRLWDRPTQQCQRVLRGHTNWIMSLAISPDGMLLVSASSDQTIRLWEMQTGRCVHTLHGHTQQVRSVAFSPDGARLISCSDDRSLRLWDVSSGQCVRVLEGHRDWVLVNTFSPDGSLIVSAGQERVIHVWAAGTGECVKRLSGHAGAVRTLAFHPDGRRFASGSKDQTVRLWDVHTGECVRLLPGHTGTVRSVAFSPDGAWLASSSEDHSVRLWDVLSGQCVRIFDGHRNWIWSVAFSPDGQHLAGACEDGTLHLWDAHSGVHQATLQPDRPYERMNIRGATGLTEAQRNALHALGAVAE